MKTKLNRFLCLTLAVLCMASVSVTAFASGGDEGIVPPDGKNSEMQNESIASEKTKEKLTIGTVVTQGSRLNLRTGAGMSYEIIDQLRPNEEVKVIGSEGDWHKVIVPAKKGYVHGDYLKLRGKTEESDKNDSDTATKESGATDNGKSPYALTPDGNLTLVDDFLQIEALATEDSEQVEKQFITLQSKNGNTFYLVIDRNGETENVYFLNLVDEADLTALTEGKDGKAADSTCSCTQKCVVGSIDTDCVICRSNMTECVGKEPVVEPETNVTEPVEEADEKKPFNALPVLVFVIVGAAIGAAYWFKFRKPKTKTSGDSDLDDYDYGQDDEEYNEETEIDDADVMAEAESEEKN